MEISLVRNNDDYRYEEYMAILSEEEVESYGVGLREITYHSAELEHIFMDVLEEIKLAYEDFYRLMNDPHSLYYLDAVPEVDCLKVYLYLRDNDLDPRYGVSMMEFKRAFGIRKETDKPKESKTQKSVPLSSSRYDCVITFATLQDVIDAINGAKLSIGAGASELYVNNDKSKGDYILYIKKFNPIRENILALGKIKEYALDEKHYPHNSKPFSAASSGEYKLVMKDAYTMLKDM